jgi:hypothetical protein
MTTIDGTADPTGLPGTPARCPATVSEQLAGVSYRVPASCR